MKNDNLKCGPTHYAGCACHEKRRDEERDQLREQSDQLRAENEKLRAGPKWSELLNVQGQLSGLKVDMELVKDHNAKLKTQLAELHRRLDERS